MARAYNIALSAKIYIIILARKKDHKRGKRSHIYIVQGEKMVLSRILQQNIMIVIKSTHTQAPH
jgi:hypothetical protein